MTPQDVRNLHLIVTHACNHSCGFCPQVLPGRAEITIGAAVVEQLAPCFPTLKTLTIAGGEAFLWRPLKAMIDRLTAVNPGVRLAVITNGTLFDEYWMAKAAAGLFGSINLSINAGTRDGYRAMHGVDHFDRVMAALARLSDLQSGQPMWLSVSCVVNRANMAELPALAEAVAGKADRLVLQQVRPYPESQGFHAAHHIRDEDRDQLRRLLDAAHDAAHPHGTMVVPLMRFDYAYAGAPAAPHGGGNRPAPIADNFLQAGVASEDLAGLSGADIDANTCPLPWTQITVDVQGDVRTGCCNARHVLGNLNLQPLQHILDNPILPIVQDRVAAGDFDFCAEPRLRERCLFPIRKGEGAP